MHYIYKLTNQVNNKIYIGQTANMDLRLKAHQHPSVSATHRDLYKDMCDHGWSSFEVEILYELDFDNKKLADLFEYYVITGLMAYIPEYGYNIRQGNIYDSIGAKPVIVEGKWYPSASYANSLLNLPKGYIYRILNKISKNYLELKIIYA